MIKQFFMPTDCKICYWGRLSFVAALGVAIGINTASYWALLPFGAIAGLTVAAKWILVKYS